MKKEKISKNKAFKLKNYYNKDMYIGANHTYLLTTALIDIYNNLYI